MIMLEEVCKKQNQCEKLLTREVGPEKDQD